MHYATPLYGRVHTGTCSGNAGNHPLPFCDLLTNSYMEVRIGLPDAGDMSFRAFDTDSVFCSIMDFAIFRRYKAFDQVNIPCINDLLIEATNEQFVFF